MRHMNLLVPGPRASSYTYLRPVNSDGLTNTAALLSEVRQLRQELRSNTAATLRAQILIFRVQAQEAAVARASQRLDEATTRHTQWAEKRKQYVSQLKWYENKRESIEDSVEGKKYDDEIASMKAQMDAEIPYEQELEAKEAELKEEVRNEEAKLGRLQDELDRMDKMLENSDASSAHSEGKQN
jgi:hypothetical protein